MKKYGNVTKTPAYKKIVPWIRKEDRAEFRRVMQIMLERGRPFGFHPFFGAQKTASMTILRAFWWAGLDGEDVESVENFWADLNRRLIDAENAR